MEGKKKAGLGVPGVAQWLTNPTRNHEVVGSISQIRYRVSYLTDLIAYPFQKKKEKKDI
ncbi:hypothetical protein PSZ74_23995 [Shigella sonnei]|nr:hypothetical protein [Shigella sonnei]